MAENKTTAVATLNTKEAKGDGQTCLGFNADYNDERNKEWAKYTPALSVQMHVTDAVAEVFEQGATYLLTFERQLRLSDCAVVELPSGQIVGPHVDADGIVVPGVFLAAEDK